MINFRDYSKIRLALAVPFVIFAIVICAKIYSNYNSVHYSVVVPYFIATILFILNRKWTDYICLSFLVFSFSDVFMFWLDKNIMPTKPEELFFFFLAASTSVFLIKDILIKGK